MALHLIAIRVMIAAMEGKTSDQNKRSSTRGISESQIREAIEQLVAERQEPTTTSIRAIVGSGSFTTIGAVLNSWRAERDARNKAPIPRPSDKVLELFNRLWEQSWVAAFEAHQAERTGFISQREAWSQEKSEMGREIARLETNLEDALDRAAEHEQSVCEARQKLVRTQQELSGAQGRIETLEAEIDSLRQDQKQYISKIALTSERAASAEARLEQQRSK